MKNGQFYVTKMDLFSPLTYAFCVLSPSAVLAVVWPEPWLALADVEVCVAPGVGVEALALDVETAKLAKLGL